MNDNIDSQTDDAKDPLSDLLKRGKPREPAPEMTRARAFQQLHAHWSERTRRKRNRRRFIRVAVAASTIFAVAVVLNTVNNSTVTVAEIVRIAGADVRLQANRWSQLTDVSTAAGVSSNSTLITGTDSRLALAWTNGGSLRVDEETEMNIVSPERIRLVAGAVYFDSFSDREAALEPTPFSIETPYGVATHLGTQFSTRMKDDGLTISVREGEVTIAGDNGRVLISAGEEFEIDPAGRHEQRRVETYSEQWQWVQDIAPTFDAEGRSAYELLRWIGRETGHTIDYSNDAVADFARQGTLTGMEGLAPMHALKALPYATNLRYDIIDGIIQIRLMDLPAQGRHATPDGKE